MGDNNVEMTDRTGEQPNERPWASPRMAPVKGVVQPRVLPPFGKPARHTNKLDYIMTVVLKDAIKHKHVWPFMKPVDAQTLGIPHYHDKISRPMDLKTVEARLKSTYYTCAQECIDDIETVFQNCYSFNGREDDVYIMAQNVHEVIKKNLEGAPSIETDMDVYWGKNKKQKSKGDSSRLTAGADRKKEGSIRGPSEAPSECGSEASSRSERKGSKAKTGKRKMDSDEDEKHEVPRSKREATSSKQTVTLTGKLKQCHKLINELFTKKYQDQAWPFYEPVNAEMLGLHDYHTIIKEPMDMATIRKNLETGVYKEPEEFENHFKLMLNNCLRYNPIGDPISLLGTRLMETFDKKWAELNGSSASSSVRASSAAPPADAIVAPKPVVPKKEKVTPAYTQQKMRSPKREVVESSSNKTEAGMRLDNTLSMLGDCGDKLRAALARISDMTEKIVSAKRAIDKDPNAPFPDKLNDEARSACVVPSSTAPTPIAQYGHNYKNGRGKKVVQPFGYEFDSDDEENKKVMSYDDKRGLSMLINKLPPTHLSTIISIIDRREKNAIDRRTTDDSEIEIDFEALGSVCLKEMDAFTRHTLNIPMKQKIRDEAGADAAVNAQKNTREATPVEVKVKEEEKKKKPVSVSETSDSEVSRKKRKNTSDSDTSSSSSGDESEDDYKGEVTRKSGQPPSSREWQQQNQAPRAGGMSGQPPLARPTPTASASSTSSARSSATQPSHQVLKTSSTKPTSSNTSKNGDKNNGSTSGTSGTAGTSASGSNAAKTILDDLLPDTFGVPSDQSKSVAGPSRSSASPTSPPVAPAVPEDDENEEERISRLRMEAKRNRELEDGPSVNMTTQMEMMSAFEYDNLY